MLLEFHCYFSQSKAVITPACGHLTTHNIKGLLSIATFDLFKWHRIWIYKLNNAKQFFPFFISVYPIYGTRYFVFVQRYGYLFHPLPSPNFYPLIRVPNTSIFFIQTNIVRQQWTHSAYRYKMFFYEVFRR